MDADRATRGEIWINERLAGTAPMPYFGRFGLWLSDEMRRGWSWELPAMRIPLDSRELALALHRSQSDEIVLVVHGGDRGALSRFSGRVAADEGSYSHPVLNATLSVIRGDDHLRFELAGRTDIVDRHSCRPPHMLELPKLGPILFDVWFEIPDRALARHFHCPVMLEAVTRYTGRAIDA